MAARRKGGVGAYAASFAGGRAPAPELLPEFTPTRNPDSVAAENIMNRRGLSLIESLAACASSLAGRCAGRNQEEGEQIAAGLTKLSEEWRAMHLEMATQKRELAEEKSNLAHQATELDRLRKEAKEAHAGAAAAAAAAAAVKVAAETETAAAGKKEKAAEAAEARADAAEAAAATSQARADAAEAAAATSQAKVAALTERVVAAEARAEEAIAASAAATEEKERAVSDARRMTAELQEKLDAATRALAAAPEGAEGSETAGSPQKHPRTTLDGSLMLDDTLLDDSVEHPEDALSVETPPNAERTRSRNSAGDGRAQPDELASAAVLSKLHAMEERAEAADAAARDAASRAAEAEERVAYLEAELVAAGLNVEGTASSQPSSPDSDASDASAAVRRAGKERDVMAEKLARAEARMLRLQARVESLDGSSLKMPLHGSGAANATPSGGLAAALSMAVDHIAKGAETGGRGGSPDTALGSSTAICDTHCALAGSTELGGIARVKGVDPHSAHFQWSRVNPTSGAQTIIEGATKHQYAPEPADVGSVLCVTLYLPGKAAPPVRLTASSLVTIPAAHTDMVGRMISRGTWTLNVVIVQQNGRILTNRPLHRLEISFAKVKLKFQDKTRFKEPYNSEMVVRGARGAGEAAAQGLYINFKGSLNFVLACESTKDRNCAIMLIRKFAMLQSVTLAPT